MTLRHDLDIALTAVLTDSFASFNLSRTITAPLESTSKMATVAMVIGTNTQIQY